MQFGEGMHGRGILGDILPGRIWSRWLRQLAGRDDHKLHGGTQEIGRLREQLAWKDAEISRLQAHREARVKELEETTVQAARAEVKLRRVASEAEVASQLAEAEVALQVRPDASASPLQGLARQLLDKALATFQRGEHSEAADLTAQARQLIDMQLANEATPDRKAAPESSFKVAIPTAHPGGHPTAPSARHRCRRSGDIASRHPGDGARLPWIVAAGPDPEPDHRLGVE
jgi:hypothetical protein